MLKHPTLDLLGQLGLAGMAQAFTGPCQTTTKPRVWVTPNGWRCCSIMRPPGATTGAWRCACVTCPACATTPCPRTSITAHRAGSIVACSTCCSRATGSPVHESLAIIGPTGVGKSWLACALGHKACRDNRSVLYTRLPRLIDDLALAKGDGRIAARMKSLARD